MKNLIRLTQGIPKLILFRSAYPLDFEEVDLSQSLQVLKLPTSNRYKILSNLSCQSPYKWWSFAYKFT